MIIQIQLEPSGVCVCVCVLSSTTNFGTAMAAVARLGPAVVLATLLALPGSCATWPCLLLPLQISAAMLPAASTRLSSHRVSSRMRVPRCCDADPGWDEEIVEDASVLKRGSNGGFKKPSKKPKDNRDQLL